MYDSDPKVKKLNRPIHEVLHFIFLITFVITLFGIVIASLSPEEEIKRFLLYSDKVLHFCSYFGISFLALGAFPKMRLVFIFLGLGSAGVGIELLQGSMRLGRTASAGDVVANCLGCAAPILIWIAFRLLLFPKQS